MIESLSCVLQKKRHKEKRERHRYDDDRKHRSKNKRCGSCSWGSEQPYTLHPQQQLQAYRKLHAMTVFVPELV